MRACVVFGQGRGAKRTPSDGVTESTFLPLDDNLRPLFYSVTRENFFLDVSLSDAKETLLYVFPYKKASKLRTIS